MTKINRRKLFSAVLAATALTAKDHGQGKGKGKGKGNSGGGGGVVFAFGPQDTRIIYDYYHPGGGSGLPPGLAKRGGDLPPGLQKQLQRNGTLPPGLQKKLAPFPVELNGRLGPVPGGCRRVTLGTWALLVQDSTNVILDIIDLTRR